jgi:hypothetical protein
VSGAKVRALDARHCALDTKANEIAAVVSEFMTTLEQAAAQPSPRVWSENRCR